MDPLTIGLLAALLLIGGGGYYVYKEKLAPATAASSSTPAAQARMITLDANMAPADQQVVIAAIVGSNVAALTALTATYVGYPWAVYELTYRIWELLGASGAPPSPPSTAGVATTSAMPTGISTPPPTTTTSATPSTTSPPPDLANEAVSAAAAASFHPTEPRAPIVTKFKPETTGAQGSYAAMPQGGDGPGDARYGAIGGGMSNPKSSVLGLEQQIQHVQQVRARDDDADAPPPPPVVSAETVAQAVVSSSRRPKGGMFVAVRDSDSVWPRKIASIGSGIARGGPALQHLVDINPHLSAGGVMRQVVPGDEVNIPDGWAPNLKTKGFDVRVDPKPSTPPPPPLAVPAVAGAT